MTPLEKKHLISKFEEVNKFVDTQGKEPSEDRKKPIEFMLWARLYFNRRRSDAIEVLKPHDRHNLLPDKAIDSE
jgi:hypothetical protein